MSERMKERRREGEGPEREGKRIEDGREEGKEMSGKETKVCLYGAVLVQYIIIYIYSGTRNV